MADLQWIVLPTNFDKCLAISQRHELQKNRPSKVQLDYQNTMQELDELLDREEARKARIDPDPSR